MSPLFFLIVCMLFKVFIYIYKNLMKFDDYYIQWNLLHKDTPEQRTSINKTLLLVEC